MTEPQGQRPAVGYVGLGLMGGPMAARLARAGLAPLVWNRSPGKTAPLVAFGARAADSPSAVADGAEITFTCLSDTEAVETVVFGPGGVAEAGRPGKLLVDMSTIRPDATAEMAERLRRETGMGWIDAPVSGGVPGARDGTLVVMAGGQGEELDRARPALAHLARRVTLMGPNGAGQGAKLINQIIVGGTFALLAEAVQLAGDCGIDCERLVEGLSGGRADSVAFRHYVPKMAAGDYRLEGRIDLMVKDLGVVQDTARRHGTPIPVTSLTAELHRILARHGAGESDNSAFISLYRDRSREG